MKVTSFDVFNKMTADDNKALQLAPLGNVIRAQKVKAGTQVTIGVGGDVIGKIMSGDLVGGLILCDKKEFERVRTEMMEAE